MYRFFEVVPGALSWGTLLLMVLASWKLPTAAAIFVIIFDLYWLLKTIYLSLHLRVTFKKMRLNLKTDWAEKLERLNWKNIYHLIILPMYQEPYGIVRESFESLNKINYPKDKLIVVLATEEKAGKEAEIIGDKIRSEFRNSFLKLLITRHPQNLAGEIPGKGSNETWAAKEARRLIDELKIPYENVLVSVLDADTRVLPDYLNVLTCNFLTCDKPQRSSFQPIPFFTNNIYRAPALARVLSFSSTFWHMMQQSMPEKLVTFSSHTMPLKALVEIGFWQTNVVSEDSRIFWQLYLHYNGDWRVAPLFYPVSMDANAVPSFRKTVINLYKQQRRWAYGAENIAYLLTNFLKNKFISRRQKLFWTFQIFEGFHSWTTNSLIIFCLGWLPLILGGPAFNYTVLSYNLPDVTSLIMILANIGIISSAVISIAILPPKPKWFRPHHYLFYIIQWLLLPVTLIVFGSFPALDAQTRLMLGGKWRLDFWATPKMRDEIPN
jgi:cellulose synthase/poly-beta-1,6-N-acetylglucosamine synthase-like glycosyltransferase